MKSSSFRVSPGGSGRTAILGAVISAVVAAVGAGCGNFGEAGGETFPSRPMTIVCPWAAGGGTSTVSQLMAALLEEETGMPVSVVHRTGGGGVTGHQAGALADPDGHRLTMVTVEIAMMHWRGLTEIGPDDFTPIAMVNRDAAALFVSRDAPWKTLPELVAAVKAEPGKLNGSGTAYGGIWHVALAGSLLAMGEQANAITWIPSQGSNPALQELVASGVDVVVCSLPEAKSLLANGDIRCLGLMAAERLDAYPDVPTFREQGVDWSLGGWRGLAIPKTARPQRAAELEAILARIIHGERFREEITKLGYLYSVETGEGFRRVMEETDETMGEVIPSALAGSQEGVPGAWFFPGVIAAGAVVLLIVLIARGELAREPLGDEANVRPVAWGTAVELIVGLVAFLFVFQTLGFLISAAGIVLYLMKRLGAPWVASIAVSVGLVIACHFLFHSLLKVDLPRGLIPW